MIKSISLLTRRPELTHEEFDALISLLAMHDLGLEIRQIIDNIEHHRPVMRPTWEVGQAVRVTTGPFADFQASIQEINAPKDKVKVLINIFGRETPVELEFTQIEKIT